MSSTTITARIRKDGTVVRVMPDGSEVPFVTPPKRLMTEAEISQAAYSDPDARPMTPEQWATARRVPRIKTMRRALRLTQEEFSSRYLIPLGTLRDWEQGRSEPDQPAKAYLRAIAGDADAVFHALESAAARVQQPELPSS